MLTGNFEKNRQNYDVFDTTGTYLQLFQSSHKLMCSMILSLKILHKCQTKIAADDFLIFNFYLSKKIRLDFPCESSA